jgi:hypothetical protein
MTGRAVLHVMLPDINLYKPDTLLSRKLTYEQAKKRLEILNADQTILEQQGAKLTPRSLKEQKNLSRELSKIDERYPTSNEWKVTIYRKDEEAYGLGAYGDNKKEWYNVEFKRDALQRAEYETQIVCQYFRSSYPQTTFPKFFWRTLMWPPRNMQWYQTALLKQMQAVHRSEFFEYLKLVYSINIKLLALTCEIQYGTSLQLSILHLQDEAQNLLKLLMQLPQLSLTQLLTDTENISESLQKIPYLVKAFKSIESSIARIPSGYRTNPQDSSEKNHRLLEILETRVKLEATTRPKAEESLKLLDFFKSFLIKLDTLQSKIEKCFENNMAIIQSSYSELQTDLSKEPNRRPTFTSKQSQRNFASSGTTSSTLAKPAASSTTLVPLQADPLRSIKESSTVTATLPSTLPFLAQLKEKFTRLKDAEEARLSQRYSTQFFYYQSLQQRASLHQVREESVTQRRESEVHRQEDKIFHEGGSYRFHQWPDLTWSILIQDSKDAQMYSYILIDRILRVHALWVQNYHQSYAINLVQTGISKQRDILLRPPLEASKVGMDDLEQKLKIFSIDQPEYQIFQHTSNNQQLFEHHLTQAFSTRGMFTQKTISLDEASQRLHILKEKQKELTRRGQDLSPQRLKELSGLAEALSSNNSLDRFSKTIKVTSDSDSFDDPDFSCYRVHLNKASLVDIFEQILRKVNAIGNTVGLDSEEMPIILLLLLASNNEEIKWYKEGVLGKLSHAASVDFLDVMKHIRKANLSISVLRHIHRPVDILFGSGKGELYHLSAQGHLYGNDPFFDFNTREIYEPFSSFNISCEKLMLEYSIKLQNKLEKIGSLIEIQEEENLHIISLGQINTYISGAGYDLAQLSLEISKSSTEVLKNIEKVKKKTQEWTQRIQEKLQEYNFLSSILFITRERQEYINKIESTLKTQARLVEQQVNILQINAQNNSEVMSCMSQILEKIFTLHAIWLQNFKIRFLITRLLEEEKKFVLTYKEAFNGIDKQEEIAKMQEKIIAKDQAAQLTFPSIRELLDWEQKNRES